MAKSIKNSSSSSLANAILVGLVAFIAALGLFYFLMNPPMLDMRMMFHYMGVTTIVSVAISYIAYRAGWITRSPKIRLTLIGGYLLSSLLVFIDIWVIARMMFASEHDLMLATVLLVFATGIALAVGYFVSSALTDRILAVRDAVRGVGRGDFSVRVPVTGRDEVADLAIRFNEMVAELHETRRKKEELDVLRRDLIAWISHDLRTPLTSIRAILEALADGLVEDPDTVQRYLRTAQKDIRSLSSLIDDLFEIARLDAGGMQLDKIPNCLGDLVSDTIESFTELASRQGVEVKGQVAENVDPVCMDAGRVGRVLYNLVSNALRYTPPGKTIEIDATRVGNKAVIEVKDEGEGILPADLPYIFDRFYRGEKSRNRATGGAGLGLAIAKGIVEAHDGEIGVRSVPGEETVFYFTLPDSPRVSEMRMTGKKIN